VWERVNDLYFHVQDRGERSLGRARRHSFLTDVMDGALGIHGFLALNMCHDVGFHFFGLGVNLEQADMTTRILDARSTRAIHPNGDGTGSFETIEWMSVPPLACGAADLPPADATPRRGRRRSRASCCRIGEFPRSVTCCLLGIRATLPHLPAHPEVHEEVERTLAMVRRADVDALVESGLKELMDDIQKGLVALHEAVSAAYFRG
jgi:uncharacterized alpha-E superfamily protein